MGARLLLDAVHSVAQRLVGAGGSWEGFAALDPPQILRPGLRMRLWRNAIPLLEGGRAFVGASAGVAMDVKGKGGASGERVKGEEEGKGGRGVSEQGGGGRREEGFRPCVEVGMDEGGGVQVVNCVPDGGEGCLLGLGGEAAVGGPGWWSAW